MTQQHRTVLADVIGWTPIIDSLAQTEGLATAAVFGVVWRYCQLKDGVCYASQERLASHLGIDRAALNRHLKKLVDAGYLADVTPIDKTGIPRVYRDTGRAGIRVMITALPAAPAPEPVLNRDRLPIQDSAEPVLISHTGVLNRDRGCNDLIQPPVLNRYTKILLRYKELDKENSISSTDSDSEILDLWNGAKEKIRIAVGAATFDKYMGGLVPVWVEESDNVSVWTFKNAGPHADIITNRYRFVLQQAIGAIITGGPVNAVVEK